MASSARARTIRSSSVSPAPVAAAPESAADFRGAVCAVDADCCLSCTLPSCPNLSPSPCFTPLPIDEEEGEEVEEGNGEEEEEDGRRALSRPPGAVSKASKAFSLCAAAPTFALNPSQRPLASSRACWAAEREVVRASRARSRAWAVSAHAC